MEDLHLKLQEKFKASVIDVHKKNGDETVVLKRDALAEAARTLKNDPMFDMNVLIDITAVDGLKMDWNLRFEVVYHFYSLKHNHRLRVKVPVSEKDAVMPTLSRIWPIANWLEREVWDMFGIRFDGHPDLRRILMYEGFSGHPLKKDYPYNKRQPLIGPKN